jgi:hypothetical protein
MAVDPPPSEPTARERRVFLSYARTDANRVKTLEEGLRWLGADVWRDDALIGGHEWWDAILKEIRGRDVFVQAVSPAGIESEACTREREYARALGKPVLPVMVDDVDTDLLPVDLSNVQLVAYIEPEPEHAFRLSRALGRCPPAPPLPEPLPTPPEVPVSYLHGLHARVHAPSLVLDEQLAVVGRLETALDRDDQRADAVKLLQQLRARDDLFYAVAVQIDRLLSLHATEPAAVETGRQPRSEPGPQPGPRPGQEPDTQSSRQTDAPEPGGGTDEQHDPVPRGLRPIALTCSVLVIAALASLPGGAFREATAPESGADEMSELFTLAMARTLGWAVIVAVVAAVIARHAGSEHPGAAARRGLAAGAVAGLAGALVHGVLAYVTESASTPTARLLGLAVTGAAAGVFFGLTLQARAAGLIGGLAGGVLGGLLVYDWPGGGAPFAEATVSWALHAAPICVGAIGLAVILRALADRRSAPAASGTTVLKT